MTNIIWEFLNSPSKKELKRDVSGCREKISELRHEAMVGEIKSKALESKISILEESISALKTALYQLSEKDEALIIRDMDKARNVSCVYSDELEAYRISVQK